MTWYKLTWFFACDVQECACRNTRANHDRPQHLIIYGPRDHERQLMDALKPKRIIPCDGLLGLHHSLVDDAAARKIVDGMVNFTVVNPGDMVV